MKFEIGDIVIGIYSGRIFKVVSLEDNWSFTGELIGFDESMAIEPNKYLENENDIGKEIDCLDVGTFKKYVALSFGFNF
ncbi:MAG: hypothetical protein RR744_00310 [Cellulosilyticaceae bacterium]